MYWRVMGAMGMSWMSILSLRIRYSSRSSGPSNTGRWMRGASSGSVDSIPSGASTGSASGVAVSRGSSSLALRRRSG